MKYFYVREKLNLTETKSYNTGSSTSVKDLATTSKTPATTTAPAATKPAGAANPAAEPVPNVPQELRVVELTNEHTYRFNEAALERILLRDDIKDLPVVVVSVVGAYRGGKSFMLDFFLRYLNATVSLVCTLILFSRISKIYTVFLYCIYFLREGHQPCSLYKNITKSGGNSRILMIWFWIFRYRFVKIKLK